MIVMRESPSVSVVAERGLWLERIDVISNTGLTVQITPKRRNHEFEIIKSPRANKVRPRSHRSELDELAAPLGKAFAEDATVNSAMLDEATCLKCYIAYRRLRLAARP